MEHCECPDCKDRDCPNSKDQRDFRESPKEREECAFLEFWETQIKDSNQWTTLERCAAKYAWKAALRWSGYYEYAESMKVPNTQ